MANLDGDDTDAGVFVLSRPDGTVRARGVRRRFTDAHAAADAVRARTVGAITGAIPFDPAEPAALLTPETLARTPEPLPGRAATPHRIASATYRPEPSAHRDRVVRAIKEIAEGNLAKVVLARAVDLIVEPAVDPAELLTALAAGNAEHNAFAVDVGAVRGDGAWLLGASPEMLLRKRGRTVTCQPYAGSAPRSDDVEADRAAAAALAASAKDLTEHAFVVDHLRRQLAPICEDLDAPTSPEVRSTGEIWHLATTIHGTLRDDTMTSLDLALRLGPTPAVGGTPNSVAAQFIIDNEEPRGLYAGAVGWCDESGDGDWMVTIRCLELAADRRSLRTWAGGGIVAQSDPQAEVDETTAKLRTVLNALGIEHA